MPLDGRDAAADVAGEGEHSPDWDEIDLLVAVGGEGLEVESVLAGIQAIGTPVRSPRATRALKTAPGARKYCRAGAAAEMHLPVKKRE